MWDTQILQDSSLLWGPNLTQGTAGPSLDCPETQLQIIFASMDHMVYITNRQLVEW